MVLESPSFARALDWYLENLGLIVSDFLYLDGQRERGPAMAFIRCDRGSEPTDHHTLAMALMPGIAIAQQSGTITGRVVDESSGSPLSAVRVSIVSTGQDARTNDDGRYVLANVGAGPTALLNAAHQRSTSDIPAQSCS